MVDEDFRYDKRLDHNGLSKDAILAKAQEHSICACDTLHYWKLK